MENFIPIEFHRRRDFSMKVNATFEFVKQNFKSLGKSIMVIAGPPALLGSLVMGNFIGDFLGLMQNAGDPAAAEGFFTSSSFWMHVLLLIFFGVLKYVLTLATINNYVIIYGEVQSNKIEVETVWARVRETFWMYFATCILFGILLVAAYLLLIIPIVILGAISPALIILGVLVVFFGLIYLLNSISLTFFIRGYEKRGFFESLVRSFNLIKDKWWSTLGLILVLTIIVYIISYVFTIPYSIFMYITGMHQATPESFAGPSNTLMLVTKIFFGLYYLAYTFLSGLPTIGIAFQYFNLVELKEAKGLMDAIEKSGDENLSSGQRPEEHF